MLTPATATIPYAFEHSDAFVHFVVFLLCGLSVYVWVTILEKALTLWGIKFWNRKFLQKFSTVHTIRDLRTIAEQAESVLAHVARCGLQKEAGSQNEDQSSAVRRPGEGNAGTGGHPEPQLDTVVIRRRMEREVSNQVDRLERGLQLLGTTVTISPFLGLLGTVWGVMRAFTAMAQAGNPDIQAMAPGISGALLTTVVGLVVAIPAAFGYNLLAHAVKKQVNQLDDFVEDCMSLFHAGETRDRREDNNR